MVYRFVCVYIYIYVQTYSSCLTHDGARAVAKEGKPPTAVLASHMVHVLAVPFPDPASCLQRRKAAEDGPRPTWKTWKELLVAGFSTA